MLKACGAQFVMLGHVERRTLFGETDELIHQKVLAAARHDLKVMLCVGEPWTVKKAGAGDEYVAQQLKLALHGFDRCEALMILYEPVWSVGAGGVPANPSDVGKAMDNIRGVLRRLCGSSGDAVPILYGGSVDVANCTHYACLPQAAGMGVGRAGLLAEHFWAVLTQALAARVR
jgi:triosephosphate isomerase